jgi:hypothetical protein
MINEPSRERSGYVGGVGNVRVNAGCSNCGRPAQPSDFQHLGDGVLRAVCGDCHRDLLHVGLDLDALEIHFEPDHAA